MAPEIRRDLVVVASSAGGVEALKRLVSLLPVDLPAAVLVALHMPAESPSLLPQILGRVSRMPVVSATQGMPLVAGEIIVARPDRHLLVMDDAIALGIGARENGHRPSHDAMFRSAALARGVAVVGVVLTGMLDDGAAGLACVARYGGLPLVQHPDEADFPSMPQHALQAVPTAPALKLADLAHEVMAAVSQAPGPHHLEVPQQQRDLDRAELSSALGSHPMLPDGTLPGTPSAFGCPDCSGVLQAVPDGRLRFRCRTGHAWSAEGLAAQQHVEVEAALWTALRVLEERADLSGRLAADAVGTDRALSRAHWRRRSEEALREATLIRSLLQDRTRVEDRPEPVDSVG